METLDLPQFTQLFQGRARTTDKSTIDFTSLNSQNNLGSKYNLFYGQRI